jgi:3-oxoacyl-[acyl-carrier-protein] reductase (EC 1.1.1.100)
MSFEGQTALVTGASRGIGRAIAMRLATAGARVIGTATSAEGAAAIGAALAPHGGEGRVLDVREGTAGETLLKELAKAGNAPTILVNNAGITRDTLLLRMKDEDWNAVLDTNLGGIFRLCRAALPAMMKARRGRIVNIGSVVGSMGNPGQANYCAAKAGLVGFSKSLAREIGSRGITVNVVAPGFIATDMTEALGDQAREALLAQIPLQRLGAPEDIAEAVAFLASDAAAYITGETLHVNGGMLMS